MQHGCCLCVYDGVPVVLSMTVVLLCCLYVASCCVVVVHRTSHADKKLTFLYAQ